MRALFFCGSLKWENGGMREWGNGENKSAEE